MSDFLSEERDAKSRGFGLKDALNYSDESSFPEWEEMREWKYLTNHQNSIQSCHYAMQCNSNEELHSKSKREKERVWKQHHTRATALNHSSSNPKSGPLERLMSWDGKRRKWKVKAEGCKMGMMWVAIFQVAESAYVIKSNSNGFCKF